MSQSPNLRGHVKNIHRGLTLIESIRAVTQVRLGPSGALADPKILLQ